MSNYDTFAINFIAFEGVGGGGLLPTFGDK